MPIKLIHVSDIHFGSGEGHGRINPTTGLNVRFEDFVGALSRVVDYAIDNRADVFLFSGDAYRNATPEPIYQMMFARQLIRLCRAKIKSILLVGNHDQILRSTGSHALSVFQSLEVPDVMIIDNPTSCRIDTANGAFQLIGLPHVTRHQLMTIDKYTLESSASIDHTLVEHIDALLKGYYEELDPELPTVVTAHMTVDRAVAGIEQELLVGYTLTFPADIFIDQRIDYVALGHVHKHQIIREQSPSIVYAGSLERVDFGEQKEDKGFVVVDLARRNTRFEFKSIDPRPFKTVECDVTKSDDPSLDICAAIAKQITPGCVLRVRYRLRQEQMDLIDEDRIRQTASKALSLKIQPEVVLSTNRGRLPQLTETSVTSPLAALDTYLSQVSPERKDQLLSRAKELVTKIDAMDEE